MKLNTPNRNTCTRCGQPLGAVCYAESMDAAVAGLAWCEACERGTQGKPEDLKGTPEASEGPGTTRKPRGRKAG